MTDEVKPGRKKRKTTPRPHANGRRSDMGEALRRKWQDPEWREALLAKRKKAAEARVAKRNFRQGVPDGMRRAEAEALWAAAADVADRFIKIMEDAGELPEVVVPGSEEEMAKECLREACKFALGPLNDAKTRLTAINTVLSYTKSKPETKSKLTLDKSEEWLAAVAEDMKHGPDED